jgi:hypothetical protein
MMRVFIFILLILFACRNFAWINDANFVMRLCYFCEDERCKKSFSEIEQIECENMSCMKRYNTTTNLTTFRVGLELLDLE